MQPTTVMGRIGNIDLPGSLDYIDSAPAVFYQHNGCRGVDLDQRVVQIDGFLSTICISDYTDSVEMLSNPLERVFDAGVEGSRGAPTYMLFGQLGAHF
jgi:hypothetical protein